MKVCAYHYRKKNRLDVGSHKSEQITVRWEMSQKVSFSKGPCVVFNLLDSYSRNTKVDQKCQTAYPRFWDFSKNFQNFFFLLSENRLISLKT